MWLYLQTHLGLSYYTIYFTELTEKGQVCTNIPKNEPNTNNGDITSNPRENAEGT